MWLCEVVMLRSYRNCLRTERIIHKLVSCSYHCSVGLYGYLLNDTSVDGACVHCVRCSLKAMWLYVVSVDILNHSDMWLSVERNVWVAQYKPKEARKPY